jgi:hypothetical protein
MKRQYEFKREKVKVSELKLESPYSRFYDLLNDRQFINKQGLFNLEAKRFGEFDDPIITENYYVLCNHRSVLAAMEFGIEEIDVLTIKGLPEDAIPRYMNFKNFDIKLSCVTRWGIYSFLKGYLNSDIIEGINWCKEIKEELQRLNPDKYYDLNDIIGFITGDSGDTIKSYFRIGNFDATFFDKIDNDELSFRNAKDNVKNAMTKIDAPVTAPVETCGSEQIAGIVDTDIDGAIESSSKEITSNDTSTINGDYTENIESIKPELDNGANDFSIYDFAFDFSDSNPAIKFQGKILTVDVKESKIVDNEWVCEFPIKNSGSVMKIIITNPNGLLNK